jgi:glycosyltransferase involved in cell wall biosynthesis
MDLDDWVSGQFVAGGGGRAKGLAYGALERVLPHFAHHITVCSTFLQRLYPKATLVPNFIRGEDIPSPAPKASGVARVAFAGTLTGYYGHAELLEELVARRAELSNVEFSILGDGAAVDTCRAIVERGGISGLVHFSGSLSRPCMMDELVRSDIGVLPLGDRRCDRARFPLKLLDYLASGCAIAASDSGMAGHILTQDRTALLSPAGSMGSLVDDVLRLAKSPDLRARLATEGRTLVRQYDADVICEEWMRSIETTAGERAS